MQQKIFSQQIDEYERVIEDLAQAIEGLSSDLLTARPGPGKWSIHEVVVHCLDSDLISIERMKRIVAMEEPALLACDESAFIDRLLPHQQSIDESLLMLRLARRQWARTLAELTDEQLDRVGIHNEDGPITVRDMVPRYTQHLKHHIGFIHRKRERLRSV
jgi:uncharacterized damage-inducible protein DinB